MKIEDYLYKNVLKGCSNHGCIVPHEKKSARTNGSCKCLVDASRTQLQIIQSRLRFVQNKEIIPKSVGFISECNKIEKEMKG